MVAVMLSEPEWFVLVRIGREVDFMVAMEVDEDF